MSDSPSITLSGPLTDWMPTCATCAKQVDGVVVWGDGAAKVYEVHCHGEKAEIAAYDLLAATAADIKGYLERRVKAWSPFPVLS